MSASVFITARTEASRLPGKMLETTCGKTLLEHTIERMQGVEGVDRVIVATTTDKADDRLAAIAAQAGATVFRGHKEDVLERYRAAARELSVDSLVIADGDDLFVEPSLVTQVASILETDQADFVNVDGMAYGTFPYGMSRKALEKVCEIKDEKETEGWGRYFTQTGLFRVHTLSPPPGLGQPQYRMTLDYPEDLAFIRAVYERLYKTGRPLRLPEVFALLEKEPEIAEINRGRQEEYLARFRSKYSHVKVKKDSV